MAAVAVTVLEMLEECAQSMSGTFSRQEILSWFRRHYPEARESTVAAHIQAMTSNAANRELNHPGLAHREPLFDRVGHGLYRVHEPHNAPGVIVSNTRPSARTYKSSLPPPVDPHSEWFWEGQVQARAVRFLVNADVVITRVADTAGREHGTDIEGRWRQTPVHVEVKGFPSDRYVDPRRAGEQKRTPATLQARVWFADGVLHVLRLRSAHLQDMVALAVPDVPTYRRLAGSVEEAMERLAVAVLWVEQSGDVTVSGSSWQHLASGRPSGS